MQTKNFFTKILVVLSVCAVLLSVALYQMQDANVPELLPETMEIKFMDVAMRLNGKLVKRL